MDASIDAKDRLLEAILPDVLFDGWSEVALRRAAERAGIAAEALSDLLPGGATELARWLDPWADRQMLEALALEDITGLRTHEKLILAIRQRLEILGPYREAVRRAIILNVPPTGRFGAPRAIYETVDAAWRFAGDRSTDINFYTKRGLLAAVYSATVLYWLDDTSPESAESWDFLSRRIADVLKIPKIGAGLRRRAGALAAPLHAPLRMFRRAGKAG